MRGGPLVATTVLALALVGCGGDEVPAAKAPAASSTPSGPPDASATSEPSSGPTVVPTSGEPTPTVTPPDAEPVRRGEAAQLLAAGLRGLVSTGSVDFRFTLSAGPSDLLEIAGRAELSEPTSWRAAGAVPRSLAEAAGARPVSTTRAAPDEMVRFEVRAPAAGRVYLQMTDWSEPMNGCWLRLGPDQVPLGFLAMTPRFPAYVNVLGFVRARGFRPTDELGADAKNAIIEATLPLDVALSLYNGQAVQALDLPATGLRRTGVDVTVYLEDGLVTDVAVPGAAVVAAVQEAGGDPEDEVVEGLGLLRTGVRFTVGPDAAAGTTPPEESLVVDGQQGMDEGCRGGA